MRRLIMVAFLLISSIAFSQNDTEIAIFTYTGTGDTTYITDANLTFDADFLMIVSSVDSALWYCSAMPNGESLVIASGAGVRTNLILDVTDDSFQVSESDLVNKNGFKYHVAAIKTDNVISKVGSWIGDGNDNRWIDLDVEVDFIWIQPDTKKVAVWRPDTLSGDSTFDSSDAFTVWDNMVQQMSNDSIQIGTRHLVNQSGFTYYYLALTNTDSIIKTFKSPSGNNGDNRSINLGWGYNSDFIIISRDEQSTPTGYRSAANNGGSADWTVTATGLSRSNAVENLDANGYEVSNDITFTLNASGAHDYGILLNEGSSITGSSKKNVIIIY